MTTPSGSHGIHSKLLTYIDAHTLEIRYGCIIPVVLGCGLVWDIVVRRLHCLGTEDEKVKLGTKMTRSVFVTLMTVCLPVAILASACADDDGNVITPTDGQGGTTQTPQDDGPGICLLNNCSADEHCKGCGDGRNTCLEAENRCVGCDPNTGEGCEDGSYCTSFGLCAPDGVTCPTDEHGTPTITCSQNSDCIACSPMNQVCDGGACVACSASNTQHCLQSDICVEGACSAKCPSSCDMDNDCSQCGGPGNEAHACNAHKCAECSPTYPCAAGLECEAGTCVAGCGIPGPSSGECISDEDCKGCGDPTVSSFACKKPINQNGPTDRGTCAPQATGCSDLGNGVAVLPAPWNSVTNLCSNDNDCANEGIVFNVGEAIRDLVGSDEIDLGFTEIEIHDANVQYKMPVCADIEITSNLSCGVCVPCETDSDCKPIEIDPLIGDLFASDPLAQIAAALLFDLLWGDNEDHNLNFFCADVAAGYGVCAPCGNPLQPCGTGQGGGMSGGSSTCNHDVCDEGAALGATCDTCAADVCDVDPYCCTTAWDDVCVDEATSICGECGSSGGGGGGSCAHSVCATGGKLADDCNSCAAAVCAYDSWCCDNEWDNYCVEHVAYECAPGTCGGGGGGGGCGYNECAPTGGDPMVDGCSPCVTAVCDQDDYCCTTEWDNLCVDIAETKTACSC